MLECYHSILLYLNSCMCHRLSFNSAPLTKKFYQYPGIDELFNVHGPSNHSFLFHMLPLINVNKIYFGGQIQNINRDICIKYCPATFGGSIVEL
jgi:hypothetical protein